MGLIKTAMMSGVAIYGVNKLAKTYEVHEANHPVQNDGSAQRQSREYSASPSRNTKSGQYDNTYQGPPQFSSYQQQRNLDQSAQIPQEYWYLNNDNEWTRLPNEFANIRAGGPQAAQYPMHRQQQQEFEYPQQQKLVGDVPQQTARGRSPMLSNDMLQQGLGFMMNAANGKSGGKGKGDKTGEVMGTFSK